MFYKPLNKNIQLNLNLAENKIKEHYETQTHDQTHTLNIV